MKTIAWKTPAPSSGFERGGVSFAKTPERGAQLTFFYETDDGIEQVVRVKFSGVQIYKCTHMEWCAPNDISKFYDTLICMDGDDLSRGTFKDDVTRGHGIGTMRYYAIYFDDGPLYEFLCDGFSVETGLATSGD
jgi:hypothetical protein